GLPGLAGVGRGDGAVRAPRLRSALSAGHVQPRGNHGDRAEPEGGGGRVAGQPAAGRRGGVAAGAAPLPGQGPARCAGAPAAGAAAGGGVLWDAGGVLARRDDGPTAVRGRCLTSDYLLTWLGPGPPDL